jgi:hypothetical protein
MNNNDNNNNTKKRKYTKLSELSEQELRAQKNKQKRESKNRIR